MATVIAKGYMPYGGVTTLKVESNRTISLFHEQQAKDSKGSRFPLAYCPSCEIVWDRKIMKEVGTDWPMKRRLAHHKCSKCIKLDMEKL